VLIAGGSSDRALETWDLGSGRLVDVMSLAEVPRFGGFSPDGRRVFCCLSDPTIREFSAPGLHTVGDRAGTGR
jgi:hypothetical protein